MRAFCDQRLDDSQANPPRAAEYHGALSRQLQIHVWVPRKVSFKRLIF
jgi:hypothetical protein